MKRVLLVNPFGVGDVLFSTPLMRALKKSGVSMLDVIVGSRTETVLKRQPFVDQIFSINKDELKKQGTLKSLSHFLRLLAALRRKHYDILIDLSLTREYAFWAWIALGIRRRVGFDFKNRGTFLTDRLSLPDGFKGKHVIEHYRNLALYLNLSMDDFLPEWPVSSEENSGLLEKMKQEGLGDGQRFLVIAPGGGASWGRDACFKQWAPEKFSRLASVLAEEWDVPNLVIVGSTDENELARRVIQTSRLKTFNFTGKITLGEAAAIIQRSVCFVGNDGGLLHMAKAVGVPTISFFGPVDPEVYGPYPRSEFDAVVFHRDLVCRPCYREFRYESTCTHRACLTELSVEEAINQIRQKPMIRELKERAGASHKPYASGTLSVT